MPQDGVPAGGVVLLDPGGDPGPGLRPGREVLEAPQLELHGGVPRLDDRVVQRRADPAHRLADAQPLARRPERGRGVLAALIGVHDHPGHVPAAHRHRHDQRGVGQLRVMMLGQGEPEHPAGGRVQHRREVQLALIGVDIGAVAVPLLVDLGRGEVPLDQVPAPASGLSPAGVVARRLFVRRAARPISRSRAATVFLLTAQPASFRSAVMRGEPYLPSCAPNSLLISALSRSRRAARGGSPRPDHL